MKIGDMVKVINCDNEFFDKVGKVVFIKEQWMHAIVTVEFDVGSKYYTRIERFYHDEIDNVDNPKLEELIAKIERIADKYVAVSVDKAYIRKMSAEITELLENNFREDK
jgi:hypothetical protein